MIFTDEKAIQVEKIMKKNSNHVRSIDKATQIFITCNE